MNASTHFLGRIWLFSRRHGVRATLNRVGVGLRRWRSGRWMALFYCDLARDIPEPLLQTASRLVRVSSVSFLTEADHQRMLESGYPPAIEADMAKRFARGTTLWILQLNGRIGGYGWTLTGGTMETHFHPLGATDVHLFDFYVFPEFRGRRLNPTLVGCILRELSATQRGRAFIECAVWNEPQLRSLARTPFQRFGTAAKYSFPGRTIVCWRAAESNSINHP